MRKPKGENYEGAKPDWAFSVTEAGFDGEYAEGYRDGLASAAEMVKIHGKVSCADIECGSFLPKHKRCKTCPQTDADYTAGELLKLTK